uniref:FZ domain-containing protein n=1 Tax=Oryzias latipes TaxID=8090 RepID=A0A3P9MEC7_ORYLA
MGITVPLCANLPYTETIMPNMLGHKTQDEAATAIRQFSSLVRGQCSSHLKPFLCSVYTPKCVSGRAQPPCRSLCEKAKSECATSMKKLHFQWPEALKCEAFTTESCEEVSRQHFYSIKVPFSLNMSTSHEHVESVPRLFTKRSIDGGLCSAVDLQCFLKNVDFPQWNK